ncbi:MAG TPA: hypothetical protein VF771_06590, partial [Longimicrobiaceae bacterium]
GDTIAAWDSGSERLSIFTPAGDFVRTVAPRQPLGVFPQILGALDGGALLLALHQASVGMSGASDVHVQRDTFRLGVLRPGGEVTEIGRFPGMEFAVSGSPTSGLMMMQRPFGLHTVAAAHGSTVYVAGGERWEVAEYAAKGGLRRLIRADRARRPVTAADQRTYRQTTVTRGDEGNQALRRQREHILARLPYPKQKPAITALQVADDGTLWVESPEEREGTLAGEWTVISPAGQVLGRVRVPEALWVWQVGPDWLLGLAAGDDGEHVRLYRLTRPR